MFWEDKIGAEVPLPDAVAVVKPVGILPLLVWRCSSSHQVGTIKKPRAPDL